MPDQTVDILLKIREDVRGLKKVQREIDTLNNRFTETQNLFRKGLVTGGLASASGLAGLLTLRRGISEIFSLANRGVQFTATIEQQQVAFETLLGSATEAEERVKSLVEFAAKTPFRLPEVVEANKQLQVMTDGTLAGADGLRIVGDAAAATGKPFSQVALWVGRLYAGLKSGTPVGEATLRLIEMGLVSGEASKRLQLLAGEARSSSKAFDIIEETFSKTTGAMERQSRTFSGLASTMADTMDVLAGDLTRPIFGTLKASMEEFLVLVGALDSETEKAVNSINERMSGILGRVQTGTDVKKDRSELIAGIKEAQEYLLLIARMRKVSGDGNFIIGGLGSAESNKRVQNEREALRSRLDELSDKGGTPHEISALKAALRLPEASEGIRIMISEIPVLEGWIRSLREELVSFDGIKALQSPFSAKEAIAEIERLNELSKKQVVDGPGSFGKTRERGLSPLEKRNIDELKRLIYLENEYQNIAEKRAEENSKANAEKNELDKSNDLSLKILGNEKKRQTESVSIKQRYEDMTLSLQEQLKIVNEKLDATDRELATNLKLLAVGKNWEATTGAIKDAENAKMNLLIEQEKIQERMKTRDDNAAKDKERAIAKAKADAARKEREDAKEQRGIRKRIDQEEDIVQMQIAQLHHQQTLAESMLTGVERRTTVNGLVKQEQELLGDLIVLWGLYASTQEKGGAANIEALGKSQAYGNERQNVGLPTQTRIQRSRSEFSDRDNPEEHFQSIKEAAEAALLDYRTQIGTFEDGFYQSVLSMQEALDGSISESIQGLIDGTMSFGEAFENIGYSIERSMLQSFANMGAEWATTQAVMFAKWTATQLAMKVFGAGMKAAEVAETGVMAGVIAGQMAVPAALASTATVGTAPVAGLSAMSIMIPAAIGLALGAMSGFEGGGYTGNGNTSGIAGVVHRREFVMDAFATSRIGVSNLYDMKNRAHSGEALSGGSNSGGVQVMYIGSFGSRDAVLDAMSGMEGERLIIDTITNTIETLDSN